MTELDQPFQQHLQTKQLHQFADIISRMQVGVYVYHLEDQNDDRSFRVVTVNPAGARITKLSEENLIGQKLDVIFPNLRVHGIPQRFAEVVRTKEPIEVKDFHYGDNNVQPGWFSFKAFSLPDNCVCVLFEDVTERKVAEDNLRTSRAMLTHILNTAPQAIFWKDANGTYLGSNDAFARTLGLSSPDDIIGKTDLELPWPKEAAERFRSSDQDVISTNTPKLHVVEPLGTADGKQIWGDFSSMPLTDEDGRAYGVLGIFNDITEQKNRQDELKKNEAVLRSMLEATPVGVGLLTNRVIMKANRSLSTITGFQESELVGQSTRMLYPSDEEFERVGQQLYLSMEKTGIGMMEACLKRKDGKLKDVFLCLSAFDPKNSAAGVTATVLDITEPKKRESMWRKLNACFLSLGSDNFQNIEKLVNLAGETLGEGCVLYTKLREGTLHTVASWNAPAQFIREAPAQGNVCSEAIRKCDLEHMVIEDISATEFQLTDPNAGPCGLKWIMGIPVRVEAAAVGSLCLMDSKKRDFSMEELQTMHMIAKAISIEEERIKANEELRLKNYGIDHSISGCCMMDGQGVILYVNQAILRMFGYENPEEIVGRRINEFLIRDSAEIGQMISAVMKNEPLSGEIQGRKKTGEIIDIQFFSALVKNDLGQPVALMSSVINITERKKAEDERNKLYAQLIQAEKMAGIGTLAGGVAHEFNNLLQIISGFTEMVYRRMNNEKDRTALEMVLKTSDDARKIVEDLLSFSRIKSTEAESFSLNESVERVLALTRKILSNSNVNVVEELGSNPLVKANRSEMEKVFLNMIINARDAMVPGGGSLKIITDRSEGFGIIKFQDTGIGIRKEHLAKMFEPFFTTKGPIGGSAVPGTGLGLFVSYNAVQRFGGKIEVESEEGKGSIFTVSIPLSDRIASVKGTEAPTHKSLTGSRKIRPLNILVIDDELLIGQLFKDFLTLEGHAIKMGTSTKSAMEYISREFFDLIFLDIMMPGASGVTIIENIRRVSPATKIVMLTGNFVGEKLMSELTAKGAHGCLQKPFYLEQVLEQMELLFPPK